MIMKKIFIGTILALSATIIASLGWAWHVSAQSVPPPVATPTAGAGSAGSAGVTGSAGTAAPIVAPAPSSGTSGSSAAPADMVPIVGAPTGAGLTIGTSGGSVAVKNFYATALGAEDEFIIVAANGIYSIYYDTTDSSFDIDIANSASQSNAEQAFLQLLSVSQSQACSLDVAVSDSLASTTARSPLSFCSGTNSAFQ